LAGLPVSTRAGPQYDAGDEWRLMPLEHGGMGG